MTGQGVSFASPEDLIIHKIFAGGPHDPEDVRSVVIKNTGIDVDYIKKWLKEFDSSAHKKRFLSTFEDIVNSIKLR